MGVLYTALIGFGCISHSLQKGYLYIYTYVGLSALSRFGLTGQCEGLRIVERVTDWLHVFYFVYPPIKK